jgi:hypothetical protein
MDLEKRIDLTKLDNASDDQTEVWKIGLRSTFMSPMETLTLTGSFKMPLGYGQALGVLYEYAKEIHLPKSPFFQIKKLHKGPCGLEWSNELAVEALWPWLRKTFPLRRVVPVREYWKLGNVLTPGSMNYRKVPIEMDQASRDLIRSHRLFIEQILVDSNSDQKITSPSGKQYGTPFFVGLYQDSYQRERPARSAARTGR